MGLAPPIVAATVEIFNQACMTLLPTPAKSHYIFNLRDVSKVTLTLPLPLPLTLTLPLPLTLTAPRSP